MGISPGFHLSIRFRCEWQQHHVLFHFISLTNRLPAADPKDMLRTKTGTGSPLADQEHSVNLVNLVYDATPPTLVSIVITEIAELPCSSAPVILRRDTKRCWVYILFVHCTYTAYKSKWCTKWCALSIEGLSRSVKLHRGRWSLSVSLLFKYNFPLLITEIVLCFALVLVLGFGG